MKHFAIALGPLLLSAPALGEVAESSQSGFVIRLGADVPAPPQRTWAMLVTPSKWWSADHSYSKDAANFSLDPRAGGCFCEVLPNPASPKSAPRGSVEHMRVIYVEEPRALRMSGALGPLQAGAGTGTLTVILKAQGTGTRILWEYAYGGYVRGDVPPLASAVDGVLAGQLLGLAKALGATGSAKAPASAVQPSAVRPAAVPPAPAPAIAPVRSEPQVDFFSEMQAGIAQSANPAPAEPAAQPEPAELPPIKAVNDQGFVGR